MQNMLETPRKRPFGVTIIAILLFISAILQIIFGIFILTGITLVSPLAGLLIGWIPLALGIVSFIFAWGLWTLKPWAYWATVILEIVNIAINLFGLGQPRHSIGGIFSGGLISLIILIYMLVDRNVREAFRV